MCSCVRVLFYHNISDSAPVTSVVMSQSVRSLCVQRASVICVHICMCVCLIALHMLFQLRRVSTNTVLLSGTYAGATAEVCGTAGEALLFTITDEANDGMFVLLLPLLLPPCA